MAGNKLRASSQMTPGTTTTGEADKLVVLDGAGGFIAAGHVVQVARSQTSDLVSGTFTLIGFDTSIPQSSEGLVVPALDTAITPKSASNSLIVEVLLHLGGSVNSNHRGGTLFLDAETDARASAFEEVLQGAGLMYGVKISFQMTAGSTSLKTFKVRIGTNNGGTIHLNSSNGADNLGGTLISSVTVWEIAA